MSGSLVDELHRDHLELVSLLRNGGQISFASSASKTHSKVLILAAASYFEHRITDAVMYFFRLRTNGDPSAESFVRNRAVDRKYHTYFNWDGRNVNTFFSSFGDPVSKDWKKKFQADQELQDSVRAFLWIGNTRNQIVHNNFVTFALDKTADEVYDEYTKSIYFISELEKALGREDSQLPTA